MYAVNMSSSRTWQLPATRTLDSTSKAAVVWFANVQKMNSFDFCGRNDCKKQNIPRQNCIKVYSSLALSFVRNKMNMREGRDLFFFLFGIVVYLQQHLWIVNTVYDARMQSRMQHAKKWQSSSFAIFIKFITTLFLLSSPSFLDKKLLLPVETGILVEASGSMHSRMFEV